MSGGSINMADPCYTAPDAPSCATFNRTDADWTDDLTQLCAAMPFMVGCTLWKQCEADTAAGAYCELPSLAGDICTEDMTAMKGCEAYNALCGSNSTVVEQCLSAGPIPDHVLTFTVKDGIDSLCNTHCMGGCDVCGLTSEWKTCSEPLMVLARMCYEMPTMPECDATGFNGMCMDPEVKENFPLVCGEPPVVPDTCA